MQQIIYHKSTIGKNQNDDDNDECKMMTTAFIQVSKKIIFFNNQ